MVFVCENNGWSEFSPTTRQFKGKLDAIAGAFGIRHVHADGNDAEATANAAREAVDHARATGPVVLECITTRFHGHFEGDPQKYRDGEEMAAMAASDPVARSRARLAELGMAAGDLEAIASETEARVAAAVEASRADALPDFDATLADVYTTTGAC